MRALRLALVAVPLVAMSPAAASGTAHFRHERGQVLNDLKATPGETFKVGNATICQKGYTQTVRNVPVSEKRQVYAEYGLSYPQPSGQYEVDHLISLELGGDNSIKNLWPERNDHPSGYYLNSKDKLENKLHSLVCYHGLPLKTAQHAIATDWVREYHQVFGTWPKAVP